MHLLDTICLLLVCQGNLGHDIGHTPDATENGTEGNQSQIFNYPKGFQKVHI